MRSAYLWWETLCATVRGQYLFALFNKESEDSTRFLYHTQYVSLYQRVMYVEKQQWGAFLFGWLWCLLCYPLISLAGWKCFLMIKPHVYNWCEAVWKTIYDSVYKYWGSITVNPSKLQYFSYSALNKNNAISNSVNLLTGRNLLIQ